MPYRGFNHDRRVVIGVLQRVFGEENVFTSPEEFRIAEEARKKREAEAERALQRQFEYELQLLKIIASQEGWEAVKACAKGDEDMAYASAFRAMHVAQLVVKGAESGKRVWAFDIVGRCLVQANIQVPDSFMSKADVRKIIDDAVSECERRRRSRGLWLV